MNNDNPLLDDYVFKHVFGQKDNNPLLIAFLNAMLDGDIIVKSVKVLNSELPRPSDVSRTILLDVQAQVDDGTYIDIEVQRGYKTDLLSRMFTYGSRMISKYGEKGTSFDSTRCVAIWLLDCNLPEFKIFNNDRVIGEFHFKSLDRKEIDIALDMLKIYPIELKKGNTIEEFSKIKKTWINFLRNSGDRSKTEDVKDLVDVYDETKKFTKSNEYRNYLEAVAKAEELERHELFSAKAIGLAEGLAEGEKKGRAEGLAEGEHNAKIETARKMLSKGFSLDDVSDCSGLSIEDIKKLIK